MELSEIQKETTRNSSENFLKSNNQHTVDLHCLDNETVSMDMQTAQRFATLKNLIDSQDGDKENISAEIPFGKNIIQFLSKHSAIFTDNEQLNQRLNNFTPPEAENFKELEKVIDYLGVDLAISTKNSLCSAISQKVFGIVHSESKHQPYCPDRTSLILLGMTDNYEVFYNQYIEHTIVVVDRQNGNKVKDLHVDSSTYGFFLSDKEVIALGFTYKKNIRNFNITLFNLDTNDELKIECGDHEVGYVVPRKDDIITLSRYEVKIWNRKDSQCIKTIPVNGSHNFKYCEVLLCANENYIALDSCNRSSSLNVYDSASGQCKYRLQDPDTIKYPFFWWTFKNNQLISLHYSPHMMFKEWDLQTGVCSKTFVLPKAYNNPYGSLPKKEYKHIETVANTHFALTDFGVYVVNHNLLSKNSLVFFDFKSQKCMGSISFPAHPSCQVYAFKNQITIYQFEQTFATVGFKTHILDISKCLEFQKFITTKLSLSQAYILLRLNDAYLQKTTIPLDDWAIKELQDLIQHIKNNFGDMASKAVHTEIMKLVRAENNQSKNCEIM